MPFSHLARNFFETLANFERLETKSLARGNTPESPYLRACNKWSFKRRAYTLLVLRFLGYPSSNCCIQFGDLKYSGMVSSMRAITL